MRAEFIAGLANLADRDPRIVLLTADLGFGVIEAFADRHPDRCFNVGVAEQGMIGLATGLAEGGFVPYCYSIATFAVARTFEFLRNGPIAHQLPVRLIGIGPGMDYSFDGHTHFALEDVGLLINQPNTMIVAPRDAQRSRSFAEEGSDFRGLVYYRLARGGPTVGIEAPAAPISADCVILAVGDSTETGLRIADQVRGTSTAIVECFPVERLDPASIRSLAQLITNGDVRTVVTAENHYTRGGFGTALADELLARGWGGSFFKWGITTFPSDGYGPAPYLLERYCPSIQDMSAAIRESLKVT